MKNFARWLWSAAFDPRPRVPLFIPPRTPTGVDFAARVLVQKIARANAARHAISVFQQEHHGFRGLNPLDRIELFKLRKRAHIAERFVDVAVQNLRLELGLNLYPTQAECAGWGETP